jgi:gliding motility-associated-like protein
MKKLLFLLIVFALEITGSKAQIVVTPGGGSAGVISAIGGAGLTLSNVTINCGGTAYGTYSNAAGGGFGASMTNGLLLTTGSASGLPGTGNGNDDYSTCIGTSSTDAQLISVIGAGTDVNDACIIEFDVVPQCNNLQIRFVFGSDEYTNWVSSGYNDAFGFFVSGPNPSGGNYNNYNLAQLPSGTFVTIDNVNNTSNTAYFINNNTGTYANHFDGFTTVLNPTMNVTPCQTYHFKLAIADAGDCSIDSGVMIDLIQCTVPWAVAMSSTPASCGSNNGSATATVSGGIGPFSYSWSPGGATTSTITGLAQGTYTCIVNDGLTCTPAQTYTVTVGGTGGSAVSVNSATICTGASTTLTATPVTGGGTYSWAPGGATTSSITISPSATTTYTVTYTLSGCSNTGTGTVTVSPIPTVSSNSQSICAGTNATLTANPSVAGGTFSWSPGGATTASITVSPASTTTYTVTYTLSSCTATGTGTVTVNPAVTVSSNSQTICSGSTTLTATPSTSGGTYSWSPGGATTASITVSPASTTTYTVTYSLSGCTTTGTGTVTISSIATVSSNSQSICAGSSATLTATPSTTGGTFSWAPGGATTASINVSPASTTTYTVTYALSGCSTTGTGTVTVTPVPTVSSNSQSVCNGVNATLTATPSVTGGTYSWAPGGYTTASISVNPGATTTYTVTYSLNGCSSTGTGTVTVNTIATVTSTSQTICGGSSATLTATPSTSGGTYSWAPGGATTASITVSPASTTTYTVTYSLSGCSSTGTGTVTVNPMPTVSSNSQAICAGLSTTLTATPSITGGTYSWTPGLAATASINVSPAATTTYTVTYSLNGCSATGTGTVTVSPVPSVSVNSPTICNGSDTLLTATPSTAGGTYSWNPGAATTQSITVNPTSNTSYTVTYSLNGCSNTGTGTVTVNPVPTVNINPQVICAGSNATITATPSIAGGTYTWAPGGMSTAAITVSPANTTLYTVTYLLNGCSNTDTATVTVNPMPTVTSSSQTICAGSSGTLTATPSIAGGTYTWAPGGATGATLTVSPASTTTYTVTYTLSGCTNTGTGTITVNPMPVVSVNSPSICPGATANLGANGATTYSWSAGVTSTGANTGTAAPMETTTYTVVGTSLGCSDSAFATVTVYLVTPADAGLNDSICFGGTANLTVTPNGAGYTYVWFPAASLSNTTIYNPTASPIVSSTYSVVVTDPNGCQSSDFVTVYANPQIGLTMAGISTHCFGSADGQSIVIATGGTPPYSYLWSGGCNTPACFQSAGTYTVTVYDSVGCTATATATVPQPTALTANPSSQVNVSCNGVCDGTATVSISGGTLPYSYSWNTVPLQTAATATGLCAGPYICTVTDNNGCTFSAPTITITQPSAVAVSLPSAVTICNSASTTLSASVTGGTGSYTYVWSPAAGLNNPNIAAPLATPPVTTSAATYTYTITATDVSGCTGTASIVVSVNPPLATTPVSAAICPRDSAAVSAFATGGNGTYSYSWSPVAGLSNPNIANPMASPASSTPYTVTISDGCSPSITTTVTVTVNPLPSPSFTTSGPDCAPLNVNFTDNSSIASSATIASWTWNFGDPNFSTTGSGQVVSHNYETPGVYPVTLTTVSSDNCSVTSAPVNVTIYPVPVAAFTAPAVTSIFDPTVQYTDQSTILPGATITSWQWNFDDPLSNVNNASSLQNPLHVFSDTGTYCAHLIVTSTPGGCSSFADLCIIIEPEFTFFIPNAFSPNSDGINDEFYGVGENITKYDIAIYDRWGNLLFHSNDIRKHWNGAINNGSNILQEDVYVYSVKLTDLHDKTHKYIGTVTIVK